MPRRPHTDTPSRARVCVPVHVGNGPEELVNVALDTLLRQRVAAAADELVYVHIHQLKDEGQAPRGRVAGRGGGVRVREGGGSRRRRWAPPQSGRGATATLHRPWGRQRSQENLVQVHDVRVRRETLERLYLAQRVDLLHALKVVLHALYGKVFAVRRELWVGGTGHSEDRGVKQVGETTHLRLQHLRKGSLALLGD